MAVIVIQDDVSRITTKALGGAKIGHTTLATTFFFERFVKFCGIIPLAQITFDQDGVDLELFHVVIDTTLGRLWEETVRMPSGDEPHYTFLVANEFSKSELFAQLDLIDSLERLVKDHGLTNCKCEIL
jgi:hypothetical protein